MSGSLREREFINAKELEVILGVSRSHVYELLNSDDCPFNVVKLGKRRFIIPTNSFYRWYDSLANMDE